MLNNQPGKPAWRDNNGNLKLHSVFETIQGEGPFSGWPALFFRLADCNLRCPGCDTDYTSSVTDITADYMLREAERRGWPNGGLIVITGGEPMRQNIVPAIERMIAQNYLVQIETNGVLWAPGLSKLLDLLAAKGMTEYLTVICSPKTSAIHEEALNRANAFKYVIRAGDVDEQDGLPTRALMHAATPRVARPRKAAPVYVQAMDEGDAIANALNLDAAIRNAIDHRHIFQLQVHKIINLP